MWSALSSVWERLGYVCGMGSEESADSVREMCLDWMAVYSTPEFAVVCIMYCIIP